MNEVTRSEHRRSQGALPRPVGCIHCRRTFRGMTAYNAHGCREFYANGGAVIESDIMKIPEVARWFGCADSTLYRLAQRGRIPAFKLGGDWRMRRGALLEWMDRQRRG